MRIVQKCIAGEIVTLGEFRRARVIADSPYDPENDRCRA